MNRKHRLANLIAQHLQSKLTRVYINSTAMHHQPRRFVDRDEVLVLVEDGELWIQSSDRPDYWRVNVSSRLKTAKHKLVQLANSLTSS